MDSQVAKEDMTEDRARWHDCEVKAVTLALDPSAHALAARDTRVRIRRVAEARTGRLLAAMGSGKDLALLSRCAG